MIMHKNFYMMHFKCALLTLEIYNVTCFNAQKIDFLQILHNFVQKQDKFASFFRKANHFEFTSRKNAVKS